MARPTRASGSCVRRMAVAAPLLALLLECGLTAPAEAHERRKLISLQTTTASYFHQPLVNCLNYTQLASAPTLGPACCTLTPADCAARCDATPTCLAFKFAWYMNTQPSAGQVPNAAPPGEQWSWCLLMSWMDISSCEAELRYDPSANFTQLRPQDIFDTYYRYATDATPAASFWPVFFTAWNETLIPPAVLAAPTGYAQRVVVGLAVGLGAPLALALAAMLALLLLAPRRATAASGAGAGLPHGSRKHDVFLSYRRAEMQVADAVHDKLAMAGLRVFYDRSGAMAGQPFEQELFTAIREAPVFAPIVTLTDVQRLAAHDAAAADYTLAEIIVALHFSRTDRVRLIFPLLVGEWCEGPASTGGGGRDYLFANAAFKTARDALPAVVPTATLALVASMFKAAGGGETLDAALTTATVRSLILGAEGMHASKAPAGAAEAAAAGEVAVAVGAQEGGAWLRGILKMDAVFLYGPDEQSGLVLRHRYAESMVAALKADARK